MNLSLCHIRIHISYYIIQPVSFKVARLEQRRELLLWSERPLDTAYRIDYTQIIKEWNGIPLFGTI